MARARLWEDGPGQSLESHLQETTASARRDDLPKLELEHGNAELSYAVSGRSEHARECALRSRRAQGAGLFASDRALAGQLAARDADIARANADIVSAHPTWRAPAPT